jgi:hypothetical protein
MVSLSNLEVWPLLDDQLMAILKLDIGIYNTRIKVSKCILVNFLESLSCGNNSFWSKPTVWMISDTSLAIAPSFVYTWISNEVIHCVNSSVTWWPKTFNRVYSWVTPFNGVPLRGIKSNSTPWLIFHTSLAIVPPFPLGYLFQEFY